MEEAKYKKNILYDSMYIKIKNRINKSMLLKQYLPLGVYA
jgi:hypothetical protein